MIFRAGAFRTGLLAAVAALALAACGGGGSDTADTALADGEAGAAGEAATASSDAPEVAATAAGLSAYVGQFPFDKVGGVSWNENPTVLAGIDKTVKDAAARRAILELPGPSAPIELIGGKVSSWACEQHNCGPHQWMVMVDPATGATDVCYYDEDVDGANARWFLASGREEKRPGNCQVE